MIRKRRFIRRRPILESRNSRVLARRRRRPLFESRELGELERLARVIADNDRSLYGDTDEVMNVLKILDGEKPEIIDEIFNDIDEKYDGDIKAWGKAKGSNIFYDLEEEVASAFVDDDLTVMAIPSHLLPYLVNGDASGLDDEELEEAEAIDRDYSVESPVHADDDGYFNGYCHVYDYYVRRKK